MANLQKPRPSQISAYITCFAAAAVGLTPVEIHAQTTPGAINRDRLDQRPVIQTPRSQKASPSGRKKPRRRKPAKAAGAVEVAVFRLAKVSLESSSLSPDQTEPAWRPFVGRPVDAAMLAELTAALAKVYARSDIALYAIVIPAQVPHDGVLRLVATEGFVSGVDVIGTDKRKIIRAALARAQRLLEERPLRRSTVDRVTAMLGDIPGVSASVTFKTNPQTGDSRAAVTVDAKSAQGSFSLDRRGITLLGRTHAQLDVQANSLFVGADQLRLTIFGSTAEDSIQYQSLSYQMPIDGSGSALTLSAGRQRTRPTILPLDGRARSFGAQLSHPVWRGTKRSLFLTLALDGLDSRNALLGYTLSNDRIRAMRAGISYANLSDTRLLSVGITASQGLPALGARVTPGQAAAGFSKLTLKANAAQALSGDTALRVGFFGQWTGKDLPSSEQASIGGDEFGRAYSASAISGDIGVAGSAEAAWRPSSLPKPIAGSELYVFADGGTVKMRARQGLNADNWSVASVGAGARVTISGRQIVEIEGAHGLIDPVFYAPGKTRLVVSLRSNF